MFKLIPPVKPETWDMISRETMKLAHAWLTGRKMINVLKKKHPGKPVVLVMFPISEIIHACGGIPYFPLRNETFDYNGVDKVLDGITRLTKTFGWGAMDNLMRLAFFTKAGADTVEFIIDNILKSLEQVYVQVTDEAIKNNFPIDSCFASRVMYMPFLHARNVSDMILAYSYRCGYLYKFYDKVGTSIPVQFIDVPPSKDEEAVDMVEEQLLDFTRKMETITGIPFDPKKLADTISVTNRVKAIIKEFFYKHCSDELLPYGPMTMATIQHLVNYSFIDFNSNLGAYEKNLSRFLSELEERKKERLGFDSSGMPRILYTPMLSGVEPENLRHVASLGGTLVLGDMEIMGFLEPITLGKDPVRDLARHLVNIHDCLGPGNKEYARRIMQFALDMKCDGVLFQDTFACKNLAPVLKFFKDEARREGIPVLETSFNNVGENVEQNKTRIEAFMEMVKGE